MTAMHVLLLATLFGVASAAAPFGTPGDCSVAGRPQIAFPGAYVNVSNVRAPSPMLPGRVVHSACIVRTPHVSAIHACRLPPQQALAPVHESTLLTSSMYVHA
jgi:hypothetical protein